MENLPFYAWECISIHLKERTIDLVIKERNHLFCLLKFLIWNLNTVDGKKGTALQLLDHVNQIAINKVKKYTNGIISKMKLFQIDQMNQQIIYQKIFVKYKVIELRLKISFSAMSKGLTIQELFLKQIIKSYYALKHEGVILDEFTCDKELVTALMKGEILLKHNIINNKCSHCNMKSEKILV